ncbi:MAG TPA: hypothetical protein VGN29_09385 [Solirubrobacteraceae bacterium]|nr:hypothetical protein [Solirubrobacteraceae bacterium]
MTTVVIAGSVVIEAGAGLAVLWLLAGGRLSSHRSERQAQQLIALSFLLLAIDITVQAARDLVGGHQPAVSWQALDYLSSP